jgi:hypothetical protein
MNEFEAWIEFAERLVLKVDEFESAPIPVVEGSASNIHLLGLALTARSRGHFVGAVALAKSGMVADSRMLVRAIIENQFYITGLVTEGEGLVKEMMEADQASRNRRGRFILERPTKLADAEVRENLQRYLKLSRKQNPKPRSLDPKGVARKTPVNDAYLIYSQLSDDAAHPSITSLNRHLLIEGERAALQFVAPASTDELADTLTWACLGMIGVCVSCSQLLHNVRLNAEIATLAEEYGRLANPNPDTHPLPD